VINRPLNRWWNVVAGVLGNAIGAGAIANYAVGAFTKGIAAEFDWERSYATLGIACFFIVAGPGSILLGSAISRWALRPVVATFFGLFGLAIMAVSILPPSLLLFCLLFSLIGLFSAAATPLPYTIVLSRQFDHNRGIVLAIMASGSGLGALFLPGYANFLLEWQGWRAGYLGLGLLVGSVGVGSLLLFMRVPPLRADHASETSMTLKEIYTTSGMFWIIALSILAISIALVGLITNLIPILTDRGMSGAEAAVLLSVLGAASWVSRISVGLLLDRIHVKYIATVIFLLSFAGIVTIFLVHSGPGLYLAAVLLGLGMGAEADLITFTMSRYFSPASLPRALGAVWIFWAWGNGIGVSTGSLSYDLTGNYNAAFVIFGGLTLTSLALFTRLGPYVYPIEHTARDRDESNTSLRDALQGRSR
jgi:MFS family permease